MQRYVTYDPISFQLTGVVHNKTDNCCAISEEDFAKTFVNPHSLIDHVFNPVTQSVKKKVSLQGSFKLEKWPTIQDVSEVESWGVIISCVGPKSNIVVAINAELGELNTSCQIYLAHRYEPDWVLATLPFEAGVFRFPHWYKHYVPSSYAILDNLYFLPDYAKVLSLYEQHSGVKHAD